MIEALVFAWAVAAWVWLARVVRREGTHTVVAVDYGRDTVTLERREFQRLIPSLNVNYMVVGDKIEILT